MDLLLKRVNLDMKLTCYGALVLIPCLSAFHAIDVSLCVTQATGASSGIVQFVEDSKAISDILAENQSSILNYLRSNNPDAAAPNGVRADAVDAFTKSCAGYCVITYLLGVGDRHLDNIMVRKNGQLFHIDFGFILGRDPKPYPPPFRLTREMAEAMGYPDGANWSEFRTKCCQAYCCLRRHAPLLLNLMSLMKDAGVEHLSEDASQKFQDRFRLDLSDEDAEHFFLELIHESLNAIAPVVLEKFHRMAVAFKY